MRSGDYPKERMGLRKTFLTKSHPYRTEKRETKKSWLKRKKNATKSTLGKG